MVDSNCRPTFPARNLERNTHEVARTREPKNGTVQSAWFNKENGRNSENKKGH